MTKTTDISKSPRHKELPKQSGEPLSRPTRFKQKALSIKIKFTMLTMVLIALITTGSSIVAIQKIDQELLDSMVTRGKSIAFSAAIPAGYSILSGDLLALDNLANKLEASQDEIVYLAVLDNGNNILAHNHLAETGSIFEKAVGEPLEQGAGFTMYRVLRDGLATYEFQAPILFADNQIGSVIVGIDAATLDIAKAATRQKIFLISLAVLAFGALCTFMLSKRITAPIERLAKGVSLITTGDYRVEVKATSNDELGELTRNFNEMSRMIMLQRGRLEGYATNLEEAYLATIRILATALDARDNYTLGHSSRVARLSLLIGQRLGLSTEDLKELEIACFLHDIGKIHVPDIIINKPVPLDDDEFQVIMKHPEQGAEILRLAESLHKYIPVVLHHHEWYNGKGYPYGMQGEEIHIFAQIVAIADTYDAMTSSRPYRQGCTRDQAAAEIVKFRGLQFNPQLTDIFLLALNDYEDDQVLFSMGGHNETHHLLYSQSVYIADSAGRVRDAATYSPSINREGEQTKPH